MFVTSPTPPMLPAPRSPAFAMDEPGDLAHHTTGHVRDIPNSPDVASSQITSLCHGTILDSHSFSKKALSESHGSSLWGNFSIFSGNSFLDRDLALGGFSTSRGG